MGKLEEEVKKEIRRTKINTAIMGAIAVAGILTVAAVVPNVLGVLGKTKFLKQRRYQVRTVFSRMIRGGYIIIEKQNGISRARLTSKGERFMRLLQVQMVISKKPKSWDGKWRLLIFDITEQKKRTRDKLRLALTTIGFLHLQNSVWVYPYDCEDLITLLKIDFKIGKEVLYIIADKVENDSMLRRRFGL